VERREACGPLFLCLKRGRARSSRPCNGRERCLPEARLLGNDLCLLKSVLPPAGKAGYGEIRPCRGSVVRSPRWERSARGVALATGLVVRVQRPACLAETFAFSQRIALRAGEGGCCLGLPPHGAPPSNPRRQPRWVFRAATARMVRSAFGKSRRAPLLLAKAVAKEGALSRAPRAAGQC